MTGATIPLRPLGRTGTRVPALCLGTMTFGLQCDEVQSVRILDAAWEKGLWFHDAAIATASSSRRSVAQPRDRVRTTRASRAITSNAP
jgi:predicted aldo/keto reductase-like oxidoreductase